MRSLIISSFILHCPQLCSIVFTGFKSVFKQLVLPAIRLSGGSFHGYCLLQSIWRADSSIIGVLRIHQLLTFLCITYLSVLTDLLLRPRTNSIFFSDLNRRQKPINKGGWPCIFLLQSNQKYILFLLQIIFDCILPKLVFFNF